MTLLSDLRLGARALWKHPGAYAAAFLTLSVGLAAATTMFSIVSTVLIEPFPYAHADRLALVWDRVGDSPRDIWLSPPEFADLRERARAFDDIAAMTDRRYTLTGRAEPEELQGAAVSPNLFDLVGARVTAGRGFRDGDDRHGSGLSAILAEPLAERLFGSAGAAVGQAVALDGQSWSVVGVLPRAFAIWPPSAVFPKRVDVWVPIDSETYTRAGRNQNFLHVLARIRPGVTLAAAAADVARVAETIEQEHPEQYRSQRWRMTVVDLREHLVSRVRPAMLTLFGAVALLLLIACANVANLLLVRAGARTHEMAVRAALGASRTRLLRQLLSESAVLGALAALAGVVVATWAVAWVAHFGPGDVPRLAAAAIDGRVLAFSAALALVTTLVFGAAPAWQLSQTQPGEQLKDGLRGSTPGLRARHLRSAFVVVQLALAVVLSVATGLLLKSFVRVVRVDTGFTADALATARIRLPPSTYPGAVERAAFFTRLTEQLAGRVDVTAIGAVTQLPMSGAFLGSAFAVPTGESRDVETQFGADLRGVTPGYFDAMRIGLLGGRGFSSHDAADSQRVAIVDDTLARRFWPDGNAVGRRLRWVRTNELLEIVGVAAAVRHYGPAVPARETVYRPYQQYAAVPEMFVEARSNRGFDAARTAIIDEVRRLDPNQPVADLRPMESLVEDALGQPRFNTVLLTIFAAIALLLAAIGIYGVMSFTVVARTREIGVRMALGAEPAAVLRSIVREGAAMAAAGLLLGVALACIVAGSLRTMLFGISPWDLPIFLSVMALLAVVALTACYLPARRAARLDPVDALRG